MGFLSAGAVASWLAVYCIAENQVNNESRECRERTVVSQYKSSGSGKESSGARNGDELPPNGERDSGDAAVVFGRRMQEASKVGETVVERRVGFVRRGYRMDSGCFRRRWPLKDMRQACPPSMSLRGSAIWRKSEMASDGESSVGLTPPNWVI
jgi:hypothetical protein